MTLPVEASPGSRMTSSSMVCARRCNRPTADIPGCKGGIERMICEPYGTSMEGSEDGIDAGHEVATAKKMDNR